MPPSLRHLQGILTSTILQEQGIAVGMQAVLARMSPWKAVGPDGLHVATSQALGEPAALLVQSPLNVTRHVFCGPPPLAFKGRSTQEIWKGKGDKPENLKSCGLNNSDSEPFGQDLRLALEGWLG